jgi:hypothetical protein
MTRIGNFLRRGRGSLRTGAQATPEKRRRRRLPSPAMIVALIALFVALSGSATAALVITGANIKNGTVTGRDLKNNSITGLDVKESSLTKVPNANKLDGLDSTQFFPGGGDLPRGKKIRGTYHVTGNAQGQSFGLGSSAMSFGWTLAAAPTAHFITAGTTPPPQCPGDAATPQAAVGHLCVYEVSDINAQGQQIVNPLTNTPGASRYGAFIRATSAADVSFATAGTWAVTAP